MNHSLLPERYKNLPPTLSMDYRMDEDNLWVFWIKTKGAYIKSLGPVVRGVGLASAGQKGFEEIFEAEEQQTLIALCLKDFKKVVQAVKNTPVSFKTKLPTWLGGVESFIVLSQRNLGQLIETVSDKVEAHSQEEALLLVAQKRPDSEVKMAGNVSELENLLEQLETILKDENYQEVNFDRRPVTPGHPGDWFEFMKDPLEYPRVKEVDEYFDTHPGAWERAREANLKEYADQLENMKKE